MILMDTDVMVDIVRRYPPAVEWLQSLGSAEIALPGFVVMELIEGCRNKSEQRRVERVVKPFEIVWPSADTCEKALSVFADHYLRHGLGILDVIIGQTAADLRVRLVTFTRKHYSPIPGLETAQPYVRL